MCVRLLAAGMLFLGLAACQPATGPGLAQTQPVMVPASRPEFDDAYTDGYTLAVAGKVLQFQTRSIGDIRLTSGRLVACDPLVDCGVPFSASVPVGVFPVVLAIATIDDDERIAFAKIVFAPGPAARWEMALIDGQDPATFKPGGIHRLRRR